MNGFFGRVPNNPTAVALSDWQLFCSPAAVLQGTIPWDPHTLERAMGGSSGDAEMRVLDCQDFSEVSVSHNAFFTG